MANRILPATSRLHPKRKAADKSLDVASSIVIKYGTRIQVKWTLEDMFDEETPEVLGGTSISIKGRIFTVWWGATLKPLHYSHKLTGEEKDVTKLDENTVKVYELNCDPFPELGYDNRTQEEVVFVSNETLLHLNSGEIMMYRRAEEDEEMATPITKTEEDNRHAKNVCRRGLDEIKAIEARLNLAKKVKARSSSRLEDAKKEDDEARADLEDVQNALEAAYAKWEVIDVDNDDADNGGG
jgi:hypothetical protein